MTFFPRFWSQRFETFVTGKESKSSLRCPCLIPEDVPIDLGVIATSRSGRTNVTEKWETVGRAIKKRLTSL